MVRSALVLCLFSMPLLALATDGRTGGDEMDHCDGNADNRYNIWQDNCHSAANVSVLKSPQDTGIVVCGGNPEGPGNPGDHTFVYKTSTDSTGSVTTTYYNWGDDCQCPGAPTTFTYGSGSCHETCISGFCDDQYGSEVRILPPGQLVEIPGASVCVTEVSEETGGFDESDYEACATCCDVRADWWPNTPDFTGRGKDSEDFRAACLNECEAFFRDEPDGPHEPAECSFDPVGSACGPNNEPHSIEKIVTICESKTGVSATGSPEDRRCFTDCINNTSDAAALCAGPSSNYEMAP